MKQKILLSLTALAALSTGGAAAQQLRPGYVDWGTRGTEFPAALCDWQKGQKWSPDDNFFISRVRPKVRFRNAATQINPSFTEENDKKLIFWVPINSPEYNALPDGAFDREVFPMWSYITHYGNWSTTLVRMPGNFMDVAHKNGVPVSVVASVPWGNISAEWEAALKKMLEARPEKMADFLEYYGVDGLGYNSEFQGDSIMVQNLGKYHASLVKLLKESGRMPLHENIWYDGTNEKGNISFDRGLGTHNDDLWGYGDSIKTSLFFNYNWNNTVLLDRTVEHAQKLGRSPLDLYAGMNMQGGEPKSGERWPMLARYPLSIGLWGAHSENMFFESRAEKGGAPDVRQASYIKRVEQWFTGGTRNPVNTPELSNSLSYGTDNPAFFGMSKLMSARSALKWNLSEEPFITYFNLGNGKFFNYKGKRQHNSEWYNIGMQDYLPTWMWWFADRFMGRDPGNVPAQGLDAAFSWEDAYMGGSLVKVSGNSADEYLHLFKTEFELRRGDVITVRYKLASGSADVSLALSAKGDENTLLAEDKLQVLSASDKTPGWQTAVFVIDDERSALENKQLAMVALHFRNAENLDLRLGEFSIVRGTETSQTPDKPVIESAQLLTAGEKGADGKIIFNMPNDKGNDVCYNIDVKTSMFKLYSQAKGGKPVVMGMTPSWAGLLFSCPINLHAPGGGKVRFGVSALSLDMGNESETAWSDWFDVASKYEITDGIMLSKNVINPGECFYIKYTDPLHENGRWELMDADGNVVLEARDSSSLDCAGLGKTGFYALRLSGRFHNGSEVKDSVCCYPNFLQVSDAATGGHPSILSLTGNGNPRYAQIEPGQTVDFAYEGDGAEGSVSRGVRVEDKGLGFRYSDTGVEFKKPFTVSFWVKPESFDNKQVHLMSIRDKGDSWPTNTWGWFYHTMKPDGRTENFTMRVSAKYNIEYNFGDARIQPGVWQHLAYVFDFDEKGALLMQFYINGVRQELKSYKYGVSERTGDKMKHERVFYPFRTQSVIAVGGAQHTNASVVANVDNLMFWDKSLTEEEIRRSMKGYASDTVPENLLGYFDFEDAPQADGRFLSKGKKDFCAGTHDYGNGEKEGQGVLLWTQPEFCAGTPFVGERSWQVTTTPEWEADNATIEAASGNAEAGSARVRFFNQGVYDVNLRLKNEYGDDRKSIIVLVGETSVSNVGADRLNVSPSLFDDSFNVTFDASGTYQLTVTGADGSILFRRQVTVDAGETIGVTPNAASGLCLLTVTRAGNAPATIKLIKK